jgi:hypothetical protein
MRTRAGRWWMVVCSVSLLGAGCGGNVVVDGGDAPGVGPACEKACLVYAECSGVAGDPGCTEQCTPVVDLAAKSGCTTETAELYGCIATSPDACGLNSQCADAIDQFLACVTPFCEENPDDCS